MATPPSNQELLDRIARLEQELAAARQRETTLVDNAEKCRLLFERAPLSYQSLDGDGRFLEVNQVWLDTLGYTRDEVIGRSFAEFLHPDWIAHFRENFPRFKAIGEVLGVEFEMRKKDGSTILVAFNGRIGKDYHGDFLQTHCIFNDISSRRRTELQLAESEKRYRTIFEHAAVGIVHCDLSGRFLRVNHAFSSFLGYSAEELYALFIKDVTHPEDFSTDFQGLNNLLTGKIGIYTKDKRYVRKDGTIVWGHANVSVLVNEEGNPSMLLATIQDIQARRAAEDSVRANLERQRIIFEKSPVGMTWFDQEGTILDCNEKLLEIMGAARHQVVGFNAIRQGDGKMREALSRALAGEASVYEDAYAPVPGKNTTFLRVMFNPVSPGQSPTEVIATLEDITKRRLAEEVLARRLLSLTQPMTDGKAISFTDLFNLDDIQLLQDQFAKATGVASIITHPDGTPITRPSNFTRLCREIVRSSTDGLANCCRSDAALGRLLTSGPMVKPCMSAGLWDAGAGISVGDHHIANWLIGQVRDETQTEEQIRHYAREIEVDEEQMVKAFWEVPAMSRAHFTEIAEALFTLASRLSTTAYQNVQQARFITDLKGIEEKLRESENRLRFALQGANDGLWDANLPAGTVYFSQRSQEILGDTSGVSAGITDDWRTLIHPDDFSATWAQIVAHFKKQIPMLRTEVRLRMQNGQWKWALVRGKVVEWEENGRALRVTGTLTDIDDRKKIEETQMFLLSSDRSSKGEDFLKGLVRYLSTLLRMDSVCINRLQPDGLSAKTLAVYQDGVFIDNLTYSLEGTPCGTAVGETICCYPENVRHLFPGDVLLQELGAESYVGTTLWDSQGNKIGLLAAIGRQALASTYLAESVMKLVAIRAASEIERREAEQDKASLQNQLLQAQKMESVGRLAGGVAHDFNNMLGVILGHVELAEELIEPATPLSFDLQEIKKAAERSAGLTRQLLAFARKQTVSPKLLDLNETVESLLKMLRRLIGEDIDLAWLPGNGLWQVRIDPTQIDQILANLTINARDAIAGVGRITIETSSLVLDEDYCADHLGYLPGNYVLLSVSDTGCGMDKETSEHIFEPFFTTKEMGQGTGLGLATIYGIVKQNRGFINVYSELGKGTTFRILLPQHLGSAITGSNGKEVEKLQPGQETILLVEDEPAILHLGIRMLERMGYTVLAAATPGEALQRAEQHPGSIDLLVTDVIMPEMNGRDLARRLLSLYPDMHLMFMSGYTADVIAHHGALDEDVQFIQKPFSKAELSTKVREALKKS